MKLNFLPWKHERPSGKENRIRWMKNLYTGAKCQAKKRKIMNAVVREKPLRDIYVLMLPTNPENQLEILEAKYLHWNFYRERNLFIVGLAWGREEVNNLLLQILSDCYLTQGDGDLRTFLHRKLREEGTV